MSESPPVYVHADRPLWRNVSFMLMWTSVAASGFGDRLIELAGMPLLGIAGNDAQASSIQAAIYFFFFLPYAIFCPVGGWLADTLPRKWVMLGCDQARAVILLIAFFMIPEGTSAEVSQLVTPNDEWKVYAVLMAVGAFAAIFGPTRNASVPQIVPLDQLQSANAIILGIGTVASLVGFGVGGWLLDNVSVRSGVVVGFGMYFFSGWFFAFMKFHGHQSEPIGPKKNEFQRLYEAVGFVKKHKPVMVLIFFSTLFWAAAQVFLAAMAAFCTELYKLPREEIVSSIAYLSLFLGGGMLLGSLWVAWIATARESSWFAMITMIAAGLAMLVMCFNTNFKFAMFLCFCVGFFGAACMICVGTLMAAIVPNYIRGRVFGVRDLISTSAGIVVNFVIWQAASIDEYIPWLKTQDHSSVDALMYYVLQVTAAILIFVGSVGLYREIRRGPMPTASANISWRIVRAYLLVWHRLKWVGKGQVPGNKPIMIYCVDTVGALAPLIIQAPLNRSIQWPIPKDRLDQIPGILQMTFNPLVMNTSIAGQPDPLRETLAGNGSVCVADVRGRQAAPLAVAAIDQIDMNCVVETGTVIVPVRISTREQSPGKILWAMFLPNRTLVTFLKPFKANPSLSPAANLAAFKAHLAEHARPSEPQA